MNDLTYSSREGGYFFVTSIKYPGFSLMLRPNETEEDAVKALDIFISISKRQIIVNAMIDHYKSIISIVAEKPFEETGVHLPIKAFEDYADAIMKALNDLEKSS